MTTTQTKITTQDAEQLLHDLVATPSLSGEEADAVDLLVGWMDAHGYDHAFTDDAGNAIGIIGTGDGSQDIVLLGHIDTFPGTPPVRLDGRTLYGRGSVDAKGPLCTFAVAAANLRGQLPPGVRIIVIGAVEEEAATSAGAHFAAAQYAPQICVIGEPSQWDRMTLGYKGRLLLTWHWDGELAHSAADAPTAGERAFAFWQRVQAYAAPINADRKSIFGRLDASIREINTGTSQNGTHQWGEMTVGFRLAARHHPGGHHRRPARRRRRNRRPPSAAKTPSSPAGTTNSPAPYAVQSVPKAAGRASFTKPEPPT